MNTGKDTQDGRLEKLLRKASLPEPSPELKKRVTAEATRVWKQTSMELSWWIPVRRLIASAAAAVAIIWAANLSSDYSVARWQAVGLSATSRQPSDLDMLPEMPYGPFVKRLASASRELPMTDASGLRDYVETMQQLLNEVQTSKG
ncbi:MAG: hypothetical protein A2Z25_03110 [Planctomycetes bacterium RBG_16_55_9]|nr:MAG: hypothetical protein A2Z25_03110 [Planctomycetes bacterium RBG_16_55_9]